MLRRNILLLQDCSAVTPQPPPSILTFHREIEIHSMCFHVNIISLVSLRGSARARDGPKAHIVTLAHTATPYLSQYVVLEDDACIYFLLEHAEGGDLWKELKRRRGLFRCVKVTAAGWGVAWL